MEKIAGIPKEEVEALQAQSQRIKLQAYDMARDVARMTEAERKFTGFKDAGEVILDAACRIEKLTLALERKYPA